MDQTLEQRDRRSLDRIRLVAAALPDDELRLPIDPPWTAAGLFALAFWDRFTHERWLEALRSESRVPVAFEELGMELVNRAGLAGWLAAAPAAALVFGHRGG